MYDGKCGSWELAMAKKDRPSVKIDDLMKKQLDAFRKRFGRDPRSNEPLFFDPDHDGPDPIP